jgi:uncharacterized protein (TIGR03435 family)
MQLTISAGDKLGPYEILSALGAGGMGEVYKARDTRLDRTVAVKVCKSDFTERFEREARAVAALNHPNIVALYDVGENYLGFGRDHDEGGIVIAEWYGITMAELASRGLTMYAGDYVVDRTGLSSRFDIRLEFRRTEPLGVNGADVPSDESKSRAPTIFTALHGFGLNLFRQRPPLMSS